MFESYVIPEPALIAALALALVKYNPAPSTTLEVVNLGLTASNALWSVKYKFNLSATLSVVKIGVTV